MPAGDSWGIVPLIAMLDGVRVEALEHSAESWAELKRSEEIKRMVMPLCEIRAIAKTRGCTRFFPHYRVLDCEVDHGGESPQHLAMKTALRDRINAVDGWHALVEYPHPSRNWIIDVLAESDDWRRRIAFEVQLSSQTPEKYQHRSQRYLNDQVFPVWIIPRHLEYNPVKVPEVVTGFGKGFWNPGASASRTTLPDLKTAEHHLCTTESEKCAWLMDTENNVPVCPRKS